MGLDGKVAIVTGAAQGIGHAVAWELALAGAAVTVADVEAEMGAAVAAAIRAAGPRARGAPVTVTVSDCPVRLEIDSETHREPTRCLV